MACNEETSPDATTSSPSSSTAPPAASPCQTADAAPLVIPCCNICHSRFPICRPATVNLCSKCYSEHLLKHEGANLSRIERPAAVLDMSTACVAIAAEENGSSVLDLDYKLIPSPLSLSPPPVLEYEQEAQAPLLLPSPFPPPLPAHQKVVNRCLACQKRVGLLGFKCKCGDLFCASHRYSDKHDCPFDYKAAGRAAIAKQNPLVVARKVEKI